MMSKLQKHENSPSYISKLLLSQTTFLVFPILNIQKKSKPCITRFIENLAYIEVPTTLCGYIFQNSVIKLEQCTLTVVKKYDADFPTQIHVCINTVITQISTAFE